MVMRRFQIFTVMFMLSTLFMAMTCDDTAQTHAVIFQNDSQDTIWYAANSSYYDGRDSLTSRKVMLGYRSKLVRVLPGERSHVLDVYEDYSRFKYKYYMLLYKHQTLTHHTVMEIADEGLFDKMYVFTYPALDSLNFQVAYDGK